MEIEFIGSGAAHDPKRGNVSILINSESKILLDTGFMNVISYFEKGWDANFIDAIYISHFHADHFFALIPLISKMVYAGRTKKLTLIGQP
ncbi:MAG: MBL fold metallo-hydrolase, partial [Proteobacteria bacterium]|nr:MBL fold metallo-hydrolase [Pseudomonadota bacterium]